MSLKKTLYALLVYVFFVIDWYSFENVSQHLPKQAFLLCRLVYAAAHFLMRENMQKGGKTMDVDVIETIYQNSMQPSEKSMRSDRTYTNAKNREKQYYKILCEKLSEEDLAIFNKYATCHEKKARRKNAHCFTAGFKIGLNVAVRSLLE